MHHRTLRTNGIALHCVEAGQGPPILLLHGFPEFWYGWRRQIPVLAAAGFRVIAPDLRGYNRSDKPAGIAAYRMESLVADVVGLIEELDEDDAILVGHDWGGVIAWYAAMHHSSVVRRLVVLNAPHRAAFLREIRRLSFQVWRSAYVAFNQLPWLPEALWRAGDYALLRYVARSGPAQREEEVERYVQALSSPDALTAAIHYYRAALRCPRPSVKPIDLPTLLIWGERDPFLVPDLTRGLDRWVHDLTVERLSQATHWLHHEEPEMIARLIIHFSREASQPDR